MSRHRLKTVLQVRQLFERRRLAEQAAAEQTLRDAAAARDAAQRARAGAATPAGGIGVDALTQHRLGGLAMNDVVDEAAERQRRGQRQVDTARDRRIEASKARRSAERLHERRSSEAALLASKAAQLQLDAVALEGWRRRA